MLSPYDYDSDVDYQSAVSDEADRRTAETERFYEDAKEAYKRERDLLDKIQPVNLYAVDDGWRKIYIVARSEALALAMWRDQLKYEGLAPSTEFNTTVTLLTPDQAYVPKVLVDRDAVAGPTHHTEFRREVPRD